VTNTPLDQVIDHAAELQRRLDQVYGELLTLYLSLLALSVVVGAVVFAQWQAER
jgi:hypothetical protein